MGILSRFFGGGKEINDSERAIERLKAEALAKTVSGYLGEEFGPNKPARHHGYLSKTGVFGVYAVPIYDIKPEDEVNPDTLPEHDGKVGFRSGTMVQKAYLDQILSGLRRDGIPFKLFVPRTRVLPVSILTEKGNIYISPLIQTR